MFFKRFLLTITVALFATSLLQAQLCIDGDCLNGKGVMVDGDSHMLVGNFKNGKLEGQGVCYYSWGAKYVGEFKNGIFEGQGTYYQADGTIANGIFKDGLISEELPSEPIDAPAKIKAIIVGINEYPTQSLRFAEDDAVTISQFLKKTPNVEVIPLSNQEATVENVTSTLDETIKTTSSDEILMFFFFGAYENNDLQLIDGSMDLSELQEKLNTSKALQTISFLDITENSEQLMAMKSAKRATVKETNSNVYTFSLKKQNEFSIEYDGLRFGLYTHYLMQALRGAADTDLDGQVSQQELFSFTARQLSDYSDGRLFLTWEQDGAANEQYLPLFRVNE